MDKIGKYDNKGFVLTAVMMLLLIGLLVAGAFTISARQTLRTVDRWRAYDECQLAAQTALEKIKWNLYNEVESGADGLEFSWTNAIWIQVHARDFSTNGTVASIVSDADPADRLYSTAYITGTVTNGTVYGAFEEQVIYVTNRVVASVGGVTRSFEETVKFVLSKTSVFNNAYFINNYGWFEGVDMVLNGDIRSNFNIKLNSTALVVNGASMAGWTNIVSKTPKNWTWTAYGTNTGHSYFRPAFNVDFNKNNSASVWSNGYNYISTGVVRSNNVKKLKMPYIGNLEEYKNYAQEQGGTISNNSGLVVAAVFNGIGPSGYSNIIDRIGLNGYTNGVDRGCLVLVGTTNNPIRLNGPVVINSDLIIKGYYTGRGTIYAGRNIHVISNLVAINPPVWLHPDSVTNFNSTTLSNNMTRDFMGLCAKGSIILGDYTDSGFLSAVATYLQPSFTTEYPVSATDKDIGYVSSYRNGTNYFNGNYTLTYGSKVGSLETNSVARKYYESSISDAKLRSLSPQLSLTWIDAVLYDNHLIAGKLGASGTNTMINGALICRDEALSLTTGSRVYINWDARMAFPEQFKSHLPMKLSQAETILWREVPAP
ncbi:MAG: hypothetical protein HOO88_08250 [Kiritimatiellaceae bacterium]|nr:hypothetical protein [Kiritimatiellaceae bacterium]